MRVPVLTLLVILGAAVLALFGGERLARQRFQERQPVNRDLANEFGSLLREELFRLEQLYEEDLIEVGSAVHFSDPFASREICETLHGIRQCHFVPLFADAGITSISIAGSQGKERLPDLVKKSRKPFQQSGRAFVLDPSGLKDPPETSKRTGWLKSPNPAFAAFWMIQDTARAVVLVVYRREVIEQTNQHLAKWVVAPHAALRAAGDLHRIEGRGRLRLRLRRPPRSPSGFPISCYPFTTASASGRSLDGIVCSNAWITIPRRLSSREWLRSS